jgi:hypothetical protein
MARFKIVNQKRAIKSVEIRYIKKYDGYCEVVREGRDVTTTRLDEEGQKYHQKIERMRGLQSSRKGCIVCGCDFKISNHSTCNNPNNETK